MDIHRPCLPVKIIPPDILQQLIPCQHDIRVFHHPLQELKLLQGQCDYLSVRLDLMLFHIHDNVAQGNLVFNLHRILFTPAQHRLDPGDQLHHAKGLCHVVVSPQVQSHHLVVLCPLCGHHDHRDVLGLHRRLQLLEQGDAVLSREHDIKKNKLWRFQRQSLKKTAPVLKSAGFESCCLQCIYNQFSDVAVILHTKNHQFSPSLSFMPRPPALLYGHL